MATDNKEVISLIDTFRNEIIPQVRQHFKENWGHIDFSAISDDAIIEFWKRPYIQNIMQFDVKCYCLKDYIMANDLTHIQE